jgi:aldehyde:ferredoxin oxidoreductase
VNIRKGSKALFAIVLHKEKYVKYYMREELKELLK